MATLPVGLQIGGVPVGGLSALAWDGEAGEWLALSDDAAQRGPARVYRVALELDDAGRLGDSGVEVLSAVTLLGADGRPFAAGSVDPEGMVLTPAGNLLISSEGDVGAGVSPFLSELHPPAGAPPVHRMHRYLEVPDRFLPGSTEGGRGGGPRGVRHNLAFESLTLTAGGTLIVAAEGPLAQDEPEPVPGVGARARVLRYDLAAGRPLGEALYPLDPLPVPPSPSDAFAINGLVELLALSEHDLLALERAWATGRGHFLRLYRTRLPAPGVADSSGFDPLPAADDEGAPPVMAKSLILDLATLGVELHNVEGIALGPELLDGRRLLVLVSDDNFGPPEQRTQFFAFAVDPVRLATLPPPTPPTARIAEVQGAAHVSPLVGRDVDVSGVVTAVVPEGARGGVPGGERGLWIQDPRGDGDPATSEGLFVALPPVWRTLPAPVAPLLPAAVATSAEGAAAAALADSSLRRTSPSRTRAEAARVRGDTESSAPPDRMPEVYEAAVGDWVRVSGRVVELARPGGLPVTALSLWSAGSVRLAEAGVGVPPAVRLGGAGVGNAGGDAEAPVLCPPGAVIDDDGLAAYEPASDGLDFWESLEGMRLELAAPLVVGPTSRYGEVFVAAAGCAGAGRTVHGGLLLSAGDAHPERLALAPRLASGRTPELRVGQRFAAPVTGILDYDFADYRLLPGEWPDAEPAGWEPQTTELVAGGTDVAGGEGPAPWTVATLNLENLSVVDRAEKFARLADTVVAGLGSPHVVALQEVQDDSGAADDGVTTSAATLARFTDAVVAAGGPRYEARWVDPADNRDGGRPGGNIRVALLFDPRRVEPVDRGAAGPEVEATLRGGAGDGGGVPSLATSPGRLAPTHPAWKGSRKPLAVELEVDGAPVFVVVLHFASKGGDDPLFGPVQPPVRGSEPQRSEQAALVAGFAADLLARDPGARLVVLGDLNDFPWSPTLAPLAAAGLVNLVDRLPAPERYTYVYEGNSQVLDHVLVAPALAAGAEIDAVHRHADLPDAEKPSDHDPLVVRFPPAARPGAAEEATP